MICDHDFCFHFQNSQTMAQRDNNMNMITALPSVDAVNLFKVWNYIVIFTYHTNIYDQPT